MLDFGYYNMDCIEGMKQFPYKYFDLAIVDPPFGGGSAIVGKEKEEADLEVGSISTTSKKETIPNTNCSRTGERGRKNIK